MISVQTATIEHARDLAPRLAQLDRQEIAVYSPTVDPEASLVTGVKYSIDASALTRNGSVLAMWGVMDGSNAWGDKFGAPWLLSAGKHEYDLAATRQLLIATRQSVNEWHLRYDTLFGFSWAGATDHHRLLRKLDFELSETMTEAFDTGAEIPPTIFFGRQERLVRSGKRFFN